MYTYTTVLNGHVRAVLIYSLAHTGRYHQSSKARDNFSDNTSMDYVLSDALKCEKYQITGNMIGDKCWSSEQS